MSKQIKVSVEKQILMFTSLNEAYKEVKNSLKISSKEKINYWEKVLSEIESRIMERASDLANVKVEREYERSPSNFPIGITLVEEDQIVYTKEAQDLFNELYDQYYNELIA